MRRTSIFLPPDAGTARRRRTPTPYGRAAAAIAFALLLANAAHAQDALLDRAQALMAGRDPAAAYALLAEREEQRAGEPRFDQLLGLAALDSGHLTRAIFAFERVLAVEPGNQPARAELARAYLAVGEGDNARQALQQVRQSPDLPPQVAAAIERVLGALDPVAPDAAAASSGPQFAAFLEAGGGRDSNVNSANNAGQFAVPAFGGLLFSTDPSARRRQDVFATVAGGASVQQGLGGGWSVIGAANGRAAINRRVHEMNTSLADGSVGLSHADGTQVQTVALQSNFAWVGGSVYRTANGASGQWQVQLDRASQASVFGQWSRQEFAGQVDRNTDRSVLGGAYARSFESTGTLAYLSLYGANEHARTEGAEDRGHRAAGGRLGAEQRLNDRTVGFAEWQHERRRYGGTEPLFDVRRRDRQNDLLLGVRYSPAPTWQVVPQLHLTQAGSNVSIYDYRRNVVQVVVRKEF